MRGGKAGAPGFRPWRFPKKGRTYPLDFEPLKGTLRGLAGCVKLYLSRRWQPEGPENEKAGPPPCNRQRLRCVGLFMKNRIFRGWHLR